MSDFPEEVGPVIRDRRRLDPTTGEVRAGAAQVAAAAGSAAPAPEAGASAELQAQLAERTADLQRLQAEYANYRRRVDRDRQAVGEAALASVFANLLPLLDDIDRARAHGEVSGGFALVADGLEATLTKLGLTRFGQVGEPFDPTQHEALTHGFSDEVQEPTCAEVLQSGYRVGERILRPARVAVVEPETAVLPDQPSRTAAPNEDDDQPDTDPPANPAY
ncbi:MAG TPA: nucleotide exchange factor GrpE [Mycobacteriales bacterium]|nr:nucleotide exchange factor GrpE [Mycobacteriales bacterium]